MRSSFVRPPTDFPMTDPRSILNDWRKFAADLPAPVTTAVPPNLNLGSGNSTMASRMKDTGSPVPLPPVNGLGSILGRAVGLPSFRGMYSPAQFKVPQYGNEATLRQNIGVADAYRSKAGLPALDYQDIFREVPAFQGEAANAMGGFVPFSREQKTHPVILGSKTTDQVVDKGGNNQAWLNGLTSTREQQLAAMQGKPQPGGLLNTLFARARGDGGGELTDWKRYGALARSSGVEPVPENAGGIVGALQHRIISGGNPADRLNDPTRVLEHELGHTWLKNPASGIRPGTPAAAVESAVGEGVGEDTGIGWKRMGNLPAPWSSSLRSLIDHDANLPEFLNYGSALQGHMFRTTGKRLETPEAVKSWTDDLLNSPDEPTFEQRLQPYPFDVRRMMRHNWRLQQGSGNDQKRELLEALKKRMQLWFPAVVQNTAPNSKVAASLARFIPQALRSLGRTAQSTMGLGSTPRFSEMMKLRRDLPVFSYDAALRKPPALQLLSRRTVAGRPVSDMPDFFQFQQSHVRDAESYLAGSVFKPAGFYSSSPWNQYLAVARGAPPTTMRHELTHFYQHRLQPRTWLQRQLRKDFSSPVSTVIGGLRDLGAETGARISEFRGHPLLAGLRGIGDMALASPAYAIQNLMQGQVRRALPYVAASAPLAWGLNKAVNPIADRLGAMTSWFDPHPASAVPYAVHPAPAAPPPPNIWQRAQQGVQEAQSKAPQIWDDTKKFLTGLNPFDKKAATLVRFIPQALRYMARVPAGQSFAPTVRAGVGNALRVGFNPYLGRAMQWPKRLLQGATLWGLGSGISHARSGIQESARAAEAWTPETPNTAPLRRWLQDMQSSPLWTNARTAVQGLPSDISQTQQDFLRNALSLGAKLQVHSPANGASWKDRLKTVYSPAAPAATGLMGHVLRWAVPKPTPRDYLSTATSAWNAGKDALGVGQK